MNSHLNNTTQVAKTTSKVFSLEETTVFMEKTIDILYSLKFEIDNINKNIVELQNLYNKISGRYNKILLEQKSNGIRYSYAIKNNFPEEDCTNLENKCKYISIDINDTIIHKRGTYNKLEITKQLLNTTKTKYDNAILKSKIIWSQIGKITNKDNILENTKKYKLNLYRTKLNTKFLSEVFLEISKSEENIEFLTIKTNWINEYFKVYKMSIKTIEKTIKIIGNQDSNEIVNELNDIKSKKNDIRRSSKLSFRNYSTYYDEHIKSYFDIKTEWKESVENVLRAKECYKICCRILNWAGLGIKETLKSSENSL